MRNVKHTINSSNFYHFKKLSNPIVIVIFCSSLLLIMWINNLITKSSYIPWEFHPSAARPQPGHSAATQAIPSNPQPTSPGAAFRTVILVQAPRYTRPSGGISFFWPAGTGVLGSAPTVSAT